MHVILLLNQYASHAFHTVKAPDKKAVLDLAVVIFNNYYTFNVRRGNSKTTSFLVHYSQSLVSVDALCVQS